MSDSAKKRRDTKLSKWLKELLGRNAPEVFQDIQELAEGYPGKTNAEVIAEKVIEAARDGKQWAIELVHDRTEGKPVQAVKPDEGDRTTEERIEDVTVHHLNDLARKLATVGAGPDPESDDSGADRDQARPATDAPGAARNPLDLPEDGHRDSQDA